MKVYLVTVGSYDEENPVCILCNEEAAEAFCKERNEYYAGIEFYDNHSYEEFELDCIPPLEDKSKL